MKNTLCMVVHSGFPSDPRVAREARAVSRAGYEVTVVCLTEPGETRREAVNDVRVLRLPIHHRRGVGVVQALAEYLSFCLLASIAVAWLRLHGRARIVHIHTPPDFLVVAGLFPKMTGARLVLDIHDLSPHMYDARFASRAGASLALAVLRGIQRAACAVADRVITVHRPYADELISKGVPSRKLTVVMNAPDDTVLEAALTGRKAAARSSEDEFMIAYHGTITAWYGVELLVEAIAALDRRGIPASALILGDGDSLEGARELARRLGIESRIEFSARFLPTVDALARVSTADCGVIPNLPTKLNRFALSSKLLEYVALGIPVAVSRLETLASHFSEEEVAFFEPGSVESLADALEGVALDRPAARARAERASIRAREYAWGASQRRLISTFDELSW